MRSDELERRLFELHSRILSRGWQAPLADLEAAARIGAELAFEEAAQICDDQPVSGGAAYGALVTAAKSIRERARSG